MTILDRVFQGLAAVALVVIAAFLIATIAGSVVVAEWLQSPGLLFDGGIVVLLLLLLAAYLLILTFRQEGQRFIIHQSDLGEIRLSLGCVQGLIEEAAREVEGIKQASVVVSNGEELKVRLDIRVFPDHHIPRLSEGLQKTVKEYVENTVGISIETVEVVVRGISNGSESRLS